MRAETSTITSIQLSKRKRTQVAFMVQKDTILGTPKGALIFAEWAPATGLFKRRN